MQTKDYFQLQLDLLHNTLAKITDGLTAKELSWQPGAANSIGFLILHIARSEDLNTMTRFQSKPQVWVSGKWFEKFGLTKDETSFGWDENRLTSFRFPDIKTVQSYADAVRVETKSFLDKMPPEDLERMINISYLGDIALGKALARMVLHLSGHIGEMSYIRGLKRGLNK